MKLKILLVILCIVGLSNASGLNYTNLPCQNGDLLNAVTNLPTCIVESFFSFVVSGLIASVNNLIETSFQFLFSNPDLNLFCAPYQKIMAILESLFALTLMAIAVLFIVNSKDAQGRAESKQWLESLVLMIIVLSFSFILFQTLLETNTYLSTSIADQAMQDIFQPSADLPSAIFSLLLLIPMVVIVLLTFITLLIRYTLIPFLLLAFPFTIFLFFIPVTKSWGSTLLKVIVTIIFMTTVDALILLGLSALFATNDPNLGNGLVKALATLFGFGFIGITNIALILMSILSIVAQSRVAVGVIGFSMLGNIAKRL